MRLFYSERSFCDHKTLWSATRDDQLVEHFVIGDITGIFIDITFSSH